MEADDSSLPLRVRLVCAQCHDHPFETRWTQNSITKWPRSTPPPASAPAMKSRRDRLQPARRLRDEALTVRSFVFARQHLSPPLSHGDPLNPHDFPKTRQALRPDNWVEPTEDNPFSAKVHRQQYIRELTPTVRGGIIDPVSTTFGRPIRPQSAVLEALTKELSRSQLRPPLSPQDHSPTSAAPIRPVCSTNRSGTPRSENFSHAIPRRLSAEECGRPHAAPACAPCSRMFARYESRTTAGPSRGASRRFLDLFGPVPPANPPANANGAAT